jgi:hypothetical protein
MSLKKYKNRAELIEDALDQFELNPFKSVGFSWWNSSYFWDYDDYWDYDYDYDDCDYCESLYSIDEINNYLSSLNWKMVTKYGGVSISSPRIYGNYIDMDSIYGKVEKRNRRIDIVLGLINDDKYVPTFGELIKKNKKR